MMVQEVANRLGSNGAKDVVVRASRDDDIEPMLAIYLYHIRRGVDQSGNYEFEAPQLDDIKRRRKNMQRHRLPHLVADRAGTVVGYMRCSFVRGRPIDTQSSIRSMFTTNICIRGSAGCFCPRSSMLVPRPAIGR